MSMSPFSVRFPDLAAKETRSATVRGMSDLPDGEYGFIEFYCDEPDCDCRRVVIWVISPTTGSKIWATINYGWENLEFYENWMGDEEIARQCQGATLEPLGLQTEYSSALLQLFKSVIQDPAYMERLQRHYALFKSGPRERHSSAIQPRKKIKHKRR